MGRAFALKVSLLVAFTGVLNVEIPPASAASCWDCPTACIRRRRGPQRGRGPPRVIVAVMVMCLRYKGLTVGSFHWCVERGDSPSKCCELLRLPNSMHPERSSERERSSESDSCSDGDVDDKDTGKESSQALLPTSQESVGPPASELTGAEPSTREAEHESLEEVKLADDTGTKDMEVTLSKVVSTVGDLMPMHSQDAVIVHAPEEEMRGLD